VNDRPRSRRDLAERLALSPPGPAPDRFRIATWNLNSARVRQPHVERFLDRCAPDVLCLQETKASALPEPLLASLRDRGYRAAHVGSGPYSGVAVVARAALADVEVSGELGFADLDLEPRLVACVVQADPPLRVASVYVPHGRRVGDPHYARKLAFLGDLAAATRDWLAQSPHLVVAGDVNVAPLDDDVYAPAVFRDLTHVTPPEREALAGVLAAGLVDLDAQRWGPRARRFTWWNHGIGYTRDLGMRIDVVAASDRVASRLDTTWIDHVERAATRPSDHAALVVDLHLGA